MPSITEGLHLTGILGLGKTVLHEIRVSGTVVGPQLTPKFPYITKKTVVVETVLVIFV